jgi:hypothetical protein
MRLAGAGRSWGSRRLGAERAAARATQPVPRVFDRSGRPTSGKSSQDREHEAPMAP